jgi:tetraacyldisaccharide 4'-kinase
MGGALAMTVELAENFLGSMRAPEFWSKDGALPALLSPLGALYGATVRAKQRSATPFRPQARVLCVGNLTAGGSGKTPIAIACARMLAARGLKVMFLSRGYGGKLHGPILVQPAQHRAGDVGDEPLLLAPHAPTIVSRDRAEGARLADIHGADVIVMDDGFQNFQIVKDISLLVVDGETGFGNGRLIPAGPLREPIAQGLARADGVVVVGEGNPPLPGFAGPIARAQLVPTAPESLARHRVIAFAGIGRPEKFFATLAAMNVKATLTRSFPDHHRFTTLEIASLKHTAETTAALLVTTEKDYVRLDPESRRGIICVPVHAAFKDGAVVERLLDRLSPARNVGTI